MRDLRRAGIKPTTPLSTGVFVDFISVSVSFHTGRKTPNPLFDWSRRGFVFVSACALHPFDKENPSFKISRLIFLSFQDFKVDRPPPKPSFRPVETGFWVFRQLHFGFFAFSYWPKAPPNPPFDWSINGFGLPGLYPGPSQCH